MCPVVCHLVKGYNGGKNPKMTDLASTGIRIYARLANKLRQNYGVFYKFSITFIGACEAANNPHKFITRSNQYFK